MSAAESPFDNIIQELGEFGKYQRRMLLLVFCMALPVSMHAFVQVFLAAPSDHWCAFPQDTQRSNCSDWTFPFPTATTCEDAKKDLLIPKTDTGSYEQCVRYNISLENSFGDDDELGRTTNDTTIACDIGWSYDHSEYESTIVQSVSI